VAKMKKNKKIKKLSHRFHFRTAKIQLYSMSVSYVITFALGRLLQWGLRKDGTQSGALNRKGAVTEKKVLYRIDQFRFFFPGRGGCDTG